VVSRSIYQCGKEQNLKLTRNRTQVPQSVSLDFENFG